MHANWGRSAISSFRLSLLPDNAFVTWYSRVYEFAWMKFVFSSLWLFGMWYRIPGDTFISFSFVLQFCLEKYIHLEQLIPNLLFLSRFDNEVNISYFSIWTIEPISNASICVEMALLHRAFYTHLNSPQPQSFNRTVSFPFGQHCSNANFTQLVIQSFLPYHAIHTDTKRARSHTQTHTNHAHTYTARPCNSVCQFSTLKFLLSVSIVSYALEAFARYTLLCHMSHTFAPLSQFIE